MLPLFQEHITFPWHQYLMGFMYLAAGFMHFKATPLYIKIMPPYLKPAKSLVLLSGIVEMVLGLLVLNPATKTFAAWSIIAMLVVFIPVHVYMLQNKEASLKLPKWLLILRFPIQLALIYWAYQYV